MNGEHGCPNGDAWKCIWKSTTWLLIAAVRILSATAASAAESPESARLLLDSGWTAPLDVSREAFGGAPVSAAEVPVTLQLTIANLQSNFESIARWEGTYRCRYQEFLPDARVESLLSESERKSNLVTAAFILHDGELSFAANRESRQIFTSFKSLHDPLLIRLDSSQLISADLSSQQLHQRSILSPESFLYCQPDRQAGVEATDKSPLTASRVAIRTERSIADRDRTLMVVNPWDFFGMTVPIHESLSMVRSAVVDPPAGLPANYLQVHLQGTRLRVDVSESFSTDPSAALSVTSYFFNRDNDYGGQTEAIVNYRSDGTPEVIQYWHYRQVADSGGRNMHLPETFDYAVLRPDGTPSLQRRYELASVQLNHTIPDSTFTIRNLGLEDGDRIIDKLAGQQFLYQNGELVAAGTPLRELAPQTQRPLGASAGSSRFLILISNVAFFSILAVVFLLRRRIPSVDP